MSLTCTAVQSPPRAVRTPRAVSALATPRRLPTHSAFLGLPDDDGECIGGLATGLDGGLAGYGEARATELDAATLGGGERGLGALADGCAARARRQRRGCGR